MFFRQPYFDTDISSKGCSSSGITEVSGPLLAIGFREEPCLLFRAIASWRKTELFAEYAQGVF
jgi:hypothetical protein